MYSLILINREPRLEETFNKMFQRTFTNPYGEHYLSIAIGEELKIAKEKGHETGL